MDEQGENSGYASLVRGALRRDLALFLFAALFALVPLYRTGLLEDSFLTPKITLIQALLVGICAVLAVRTWRNGPPTRWTGMDGLVLIYLAVNLASSSYARSPALALHANIYLLTMVVLYFACRLALRTPLEILAVLSAGIAAAVLTAIWTIWEDLTRGRFEGIVARLPDWRGHLAAGLGNSGHIAGFIGLFFPAALFLYLSRRRYPGLLLVAIAMFVAALAVTWSVGSTGALILSLAFWIPVAFLRRQALQLHWGRLAPLALLAALAALFFLLPHPFNPHPGGLLGDAFGSDRWKTGGVTRWVIWLTTAHMIRTHLLLGVGAGNFTLEYVRQMPPSVIGDQDLRMYAGAFTNDAHNEYLQILAETGPVGLLAFLSIAAALFIRVRRMVRSTTGDELVITLCVGAGATVFLLDSLMTFPLRLPPHMATLMLFLAVAQSVSAVATTGRPRLAGRLTGMALLVLVVVSAAPHSRRVAAEYHLKAGRSLAETTALVTMTGPTSPWSAADTLYQKAMTSLARGDTSQIPAIARTMQDAASQPGMSAAEASFRRALRWDPHYTNASSRLGSLLLFQGRYPEAAEVLGNTLKGLESSEIYERLGYAQYMLGDLASAARQWQICKERRPGMAALYGALLKQVNR